MNAPPLVIASHQRSGTHLLMDTLRRSFPPVIGVAGWGRNPHDSLYFSLDRLNAVHHRPATPDEMRRALDRIDRPMLKTHNLPAMDEIAPDHRSYLDSVLDGAVVLYCVRDGRDVLCSLQSFRADFDPNVSERISDFIRETDGGKSRVRLWAEHVESWLDHPGVTPIHFRDTVKKTREVLETVSQKTGMTPDLADPLLPPRQASRLKHWMNRVTGRVDSTNIIGRAKGGEPAKWRDAFTPDDRAFFRDEAGDTLVRLGYEPDHSWADTPQGASV